MLKLNGLRHSFISYRVAAIKKVAEVALEAGNSPQMIFSNYRELVSRDAKEWFAIVPPGIAGGKARRVVWPWNFLARRPTGIRMAIYGSLRWGPI